MARGNAALQKKLAELESEIGRLLERPSSYIHDDINGKVGLYQIARKITFIKNLLTAEMDSQCGGGAEHLNDMAMRLSILEKTFVNWAIAARFSILDEPLVNRVESGDGNGSVNKSSDTSASCSCTESCVLDEEFVEEDNVNQEAKGFGASETGTILSQVAERGWAESKEEGIDDEEENERIQEEEKEGEREVVATKDEKRKDRKQGEVTEDEEERRERIQGGKASESKVEVNEDEKAGEQQQEAEMVEERKLAVKEDAQERDRDRKGKTVEKVEVEATEEKGRWKQEGEMAGERKFKAAEDKGSERKGRADLAGERRAKEIEEAMAEEKSAGVKDEKEIERNPERQMVGQCVAEVILDKQEERKEEGEMMRATMRGRVRKREAEMVETQKIEIKEDEKGRERKQESSCRVKNCMAMGFAAAAGFTIALIGVAVANICWAEEMVYLVPT